MEFPRSGRKAGDPRQVQILFLGAGARRVSLGHCGGRGCSEMMASRGGLAQRQRAQGLVFSAGAFSFGKLTNWERKR